MRKTKRRGTGVSMIRIFAMGAAGIDFSAAKWEPYLSEERKAEAARRKNTAERQLCLAAEALLNRSLELVGAPVRLPAVYRRNEHGKPYLTEDCGLYVNWSHSGGYVLCAVADREVGADLQKADREPREALLRRVLRPQERAFWEAADLERRTALFYEYWAVKESFLKALGTGFYTSLDDFEVIRSEERPETPRILQRVNEKYYGCRLLPFCEAGYAAAVCCEGEEPDGRIEYLRADF